MKTWGANSIKLRNPYGEATEEDISTFEAAEGISFPPDYREYLRAFNGGKFLKDCFFISDRICGQLHSVYGLHQGPAFARLQDRWKLSKYFEIGDLAPEVSDYLVFAGTDTGDLLLLRFSNGAVYFLDHESIDYSDDMSHAKSVNPNLIASNFDAFVEGLEDSTSEH